MELRMQREESLATPHPRVHGGVSWATRALSQWQCCSAAPPVKEEVRTIRCASAALVCHHLIKYKRADD